MDYTFHIIFPHLLSSFILSLSHLYLLPFFLRYFVPIYFTPQPSQSFSLILGTVPYHSYKLTQYSVTYMHAFLFRARELQRAIENFFTEEPGIRAEHRKSFPSSATIAVGFISNVFRL
jgi:hypothetical protein